MNRLMISLAVCMLGGACGSSSVAINTLMPAPADVAGWSEDAAQGTAGVAVARTPAEAEAFVDGDAAPFTAHSFIAFAWQQYTKDTYRLDLRIWQFADTAAATAIYDDLLTDSSLYSSAAWTPEAAGDAGRIADTGTSWWINTRKKGYYVEAKMTTNPPAAPNATGRTDAEAFVNAVLAKIP